MPSPALSLLDLEPVPTLLARLRSEASASFDFSKPVRVSRAPGRLDVMGGITDYTGGLVCEIPLSVATAAALQDRNDLQINVLSLNLLDEHRPFTFQMPLRGLTVPLDQLRRELLEPGREWAGYVVGCLAVIHESGFVDLTDPRHQGLNIAIYSTVPSGAGVGSSAALEVATMNLLVDHFGAKSLRENDLQLAVLCQRVENRVVGAPCGVMDQVASHLGQAGAMLRMLSQPHELQSLLHFPQGVKAIGINTNVKHSVRGDPYQRTRAAAFMGHRMILKEMRRFANEAGKEMVGDPTGGYLANLPPEDYKALFRIKLPESISGRKFIEIIGDHGDGATTIDPDAEYPIQRACDHHVLESQRVRRFCDFMENVDKYGRYKALASAGHLMYASHRSYTTNARLGAEEADDLVERVKQNESAGLYGAKITGGGSGGTVAVLMNDTAEAAEAVAGIADTYQQRTGLRADVFDGTSPGAAQFGSVIVAPGT